MAELEYLLNKRGKEKRDGGQFLAYWKALEQGYFSSELIRQTEARINFILEPQIEQILIKIRSLNKSIETSNENLSELLEEEESLCLEIEALNLQRSNQLETVMGSYNFFKSGEVENMLSSLSVENMRAESMNQESELASLEKRVSTLQSLPSKVLERVAWSHQVP
jgi:hypothetical protein